MSKNSQKVKIFRKLNANSCSSNNYYNNSKNSRLKRVKKKKSKSKKIRILIKIISCFFKKKILPYMKIITKLRIIILFQVTPPVIRIINILKNQL